MKGKFSKFIGLALLLALAAYGYFGFAPADNSVSQAPSEIAPPPAQAAPADGVLRLVENAAIKNSGKVIYRGPVDLTATIERIRAGERYPHRNDGSVFGNRERLLPQKPRGYYREYVHPTEGIDGPGPQRLVVGDDGDWWYTPDHYDSFVKLGRESP